MRWGLAEHLLAVIADAVHVSNWQRSGDKNIPKPKRIVRPGVTSETNGRRFKAKRSFSIAEMQQIQRNWSQGR